MKFVNYKDLYEMVVNYFEGLDNEDEIMLAVLRREKRDPILKQFDGYLTVGEHEKTEKRNGWIYWGSRKFKEDLVVFHGDGCLWDSVKRPNVEQVRHDGLAAMCTTIDDIIAIPHMATADEIATIKKEGCCHQAPLDFYGEVRPNEESTHSEKEVEEKHLKDEKESKENGEKISALDNLKLACSVAAAVTGNNMGNYLCDLIDAVFAMDEEPKADLISSSDKTKLDEITAGAKEEPVEEPKKDILKARCTKGCTYPFVGNSMFTTGKVYERVNGVLVDDAGLKWEASCENDNPAEWAFKWTSGAEFELYEEPKQEPVEEPVEEPKKDILKVKCVWTDRPTWWTVGKVYERVNGVLVDESGWPHMFKISDNDPAKWTFRHAKFELYEEPKEEPKKDILKVKCTNKKYYFCDYFTVGKVYEVVNGVLTDDDGDEWDCDDVDPSEWDFDAEFELCPNDLKVKCVWISNPVSESWTVGKVYKRVDGVLFDDAGYEWGVHMCNGDDPTKWAFSAARFELAE